MIEVVRTGDADPLEFRIVIKDEKSESRHDVTMARETYKRLTAGTHTPEACIEAAFRFLLDRETKESILGRFDISVIRGYFPEFERELPAYLSPS